MECIVYRTGGKENFVWHRSLPYLTREETYLRKAELEKMGYLCLIVNYRQSLAIGLPEGYEK